jgi:hypothetical protein
MECTSQGKVVMGIHICMGLALKNNILVDVTEDYRKMYSASDIFKPLLILEITRKHAEFGGMVKTYKFSDGARSPRLVLLKGTTTRNAPS